MWQPRAVDGAGMVSVLATRLVADKAFAGITWRVVQRGHTLDEGACGHADHALSRPLTRDAIFRIYSMTKPVVSVAVLQLVESGQLTLDTPVRRWLPAFGRCRVLGADGRSSAAARPMTVEDLLTHRAGLSYDFLPDCPVATLYRERRFAEDGSRSLEALVEALAALPLAASPGVEFRYSYATDVLGHLLERVLDRPLRDVLAERLLHPLGMMETDFGVPAAARSRLVDMHGMRALGEVPAPPPPDREPEQRLRPMDVSASYPVDAAGRFARGGLGLFSTLDDYARFAAMLVDGRTSSGETLLSAPMIDMLWRNRLPAAQRPIRVGANVMHGYGWGLIGRVMTDVGASMHLSGDGEGGWAGAASTWFWVDRANDLHGVVLAQFLGSAVALGPLVQGVAYAGLTRGERGG